MNALTLNIQTMSSREIAELTGKEHKNVMRVIDDLISAQILTAQIERLNYEHRGNTYHYYELNKRDSMVVVARLSPEFMAAVVDRWQELENNPADNTLQKVASAFESLHKIATIAGFQGNQAVLSADKGTQKLLGCSPLALIDATHLTAPKQELTLNPTQLGQLMTEVKSARKVNVLLQEKGLQEKVADQWVATEKGREFSELLDTGKKHSDGTPIKQLKWFQSVLKVLN